MNWLSLASKKFTNQLDKFNDRFTSYRLVLYFLIALLSWAVIGSFFNQVPYDWTEILPSAAILLAVCWLINKLIAGFLNIPANQESSLITALILTLILTPPQDGVGYAILAAIGVA